jgi:outer membrane receptor protein involved in Fe transport
VLEQYAGLRDRFTVSAYRYEVEGLISQLVTSAGDVYFGNLSRATANGLELEWERKYEHGLLARVSYALQRTEDGESHRTLSSSPRHLAKLNFGMPVRGKLDAGLELQYQSSVATLAGQHADAFVLGNLSLTARARPDLQLSAGLYNIFNTRYAYPGAEDHLQDVIVQDGRTVRVSVRYAF